MGINVRLSEMVHTPHAWLVISQYVMSKKQTLSLKWLHGKAQVVMASRYVPNVVLCKA